MHFTASGCKVSGTNAGGCREELAKKSTNHRENRRLTFRESRVTKSDRRAEGTERVGRIELHCAGILWAVLLPDVTPTWEVVMGKTVELIAAVAMTRMSWLPVRG